MQKFKPITLLILDGWGLSPSWGGNALTMNNPRHIDEFWRTYPHTVLQALNAIAKGAPIADSHLGHTMIGAGRMVESNFGRINKTIQDKSFYKNRVLLGAIEWAKKNNSNLHLLGMISEGGIHSHLGHLTELLKLCGRQNFTRVFLDAITDGTDSGPTDALVFIDKIKRKMQELKLGAFSSVAGRSLAMDRDKNWARAATAYEMLTLGKGEKYPSVEEAVSANYRQGINDEFIKPGLIKQANGSYVTIKDNDAIIFFNFREDRARQLTQLFIQPNFRQFFWKPKQLTDLYFVTFVAYQKDLPSRVAFPETIYRQTLTETVSQANFKQLKVAESEKYAHVTYFINGGAEEPFAGEERKIIRSPAGPHDKNPAMAADAIAKAVVRAIHSAAYDLIIVNFANVDMVAHTGNIMAVGQAVKVVDECVGKIAEANLKAGGATLITADHGNAEQMIELNKNFAREKETLHTLNPVPFILVAPKMKKNLLKSAIGYNPNALAKILQAQDTLADVAPTILELLGLPKPAAMTGHSLLNKLE